MPRKGLYPIFLYRPDYQLDFQFNATERWYTFFCASLLLYVIFLDFYILIMITKWNSKHWWYKILKNLNFRNQSKHYMNSSSTNLSKTGKNNIFRINWYIQKENIIKTMKFPFVLGDFCICRWKDNIFYFSHISSCLWYFWSDFQTFCLSVIK